MNISNESVKKIVVEIPEGHMHIRTTVILDNGISMTFQEATIANIVRAYINVKTDPVRTSVRLTGTAVENRKKGFAEWQLIEEELRS